MKTSQLSVVLLAFALLVAGASATLSTQVLKFYAPFGGKDPSTSSSGTVIAYTTGGTQTAALRIHKITPPTGFALNTTLSSSSYTCPWACTGTTACTATSGTATFTVSSGVFSIDMGGDAEASKTYTITCTATGGLFLSAITSSTTIPTTVAQNGGAASATSWLWATYKSDGSTAATDASDTSLTATPTVLEPATSIVASSYVSSASSVTATITFYTPQAMASGDTIVFTFPSSYSTGSTSGAAISSATVNGGSFTTTPTVSCSTLVCTITIKDTRAAGDKMQIVITGLTNPSYVGSAKVTLSTTAGTGATFADYVMQTFSSSSSALAAGLSAILATLLCLLL